MLTIIRKSLSLIGCYWHIKRGVLQVLFRAKASQTSVKSFDNDEKIDFLKGELQPSCR